MFDYKFNNLDLAHKIDAASAPKEDYSKHIHHFYEVIYFVKGDVQYTVESATKPLAEGDLVFIESGKYHFATVNSDVEYERYVFKFPAAILPAHLRESLKNCGPFFGIQLKYASVFSKYESYISNYTDEEIATMFTCDITKILLELCHDSINPQVRTKSVVTEIIRFVDDNITRPITLDTIARYLRFSKSYIVREFKKYMRVSLIQYVNAKKVYAAHVLLLNGEKKTTVARQLGFEDYSTFYRCYTKIMGHSPSDVKKLREPRTHS